jgi:hypothetical protein
MVFDEVNVMSTRPPTPSKRKAKINKQNEQFRYFDETAYFYR